MSSPQAKTPRATGTAKKAPKKPTKKPAPKKAAKKPTTPKTPKAPVEKNLGGRPRAFQDGEELSRKIQEYFDTIGPVVLKDDKGNPVYTQYGKPVVMATRHPSFFALARHLEVDRTTLYAEMTSGTFSHIITRASERIQEYMVERMMDSDVKPPGIQFVLKNIHGWKDETEVKTSGSMTLAGDPNKPLVPALIQIELVRPKEANDSSPTADIPVPGED